MLVEENFIRLPTTSPLTAVPGGWAIVGMTRSKTLPPDGTVPPATVHVSSPSAASGSSTVAVTVFSAAAVLAAGLVAHAGRQVVGDACGEVSSAPGKSTRSFQQIRSPGW